MTDGVDHLAEAQQFAYWAGNAYQEGEDFTSDAALMGMLHALIALAVTIERLAGR